MKLNRAIYYVKFLLCLGTFISVHSLQAQPIVGTADRIIAVVGKNRIILQSDLDVQYAQYKDRDPNVSDTIKCNLLQQMIIQKLLVEQADRDSLLVSNDDVEGTIENRIRQFVRQYGSKEKLEEVAGKTIYQLKEENRELFKEQLMAEKMQSKILENVKITPAEVQAFYNTIPADSLPFFPAAVEVGQIVIEPSVSKELDEYARKKLEDIRRQIVSEGKNFETMAGLYSDDPGSRDNGGRYNDVNRTGGGWAPEFVAAAFKLQNGEVSPIIKTQFGYHIIQMVQRKGEVADVRHILIRPERTTADFKRALEKLDSVRSLLISGKYTFAEAVGKFSTDDAAKTTGGMIIDPQSGSAQLEIDHLDPAMVLMLDTMKVGGFSQPQMFTTDRGDKSTRIVYLKNRTVPHKANLKDDYSRIQQVALQQKQAKRTEEWLKSRLPNYYMKIDPSYSSCHVFDNWKISSTSK
ncbi:MAG: peptidylprolyl isomerase [Bacteroidetes bacterium]|nr:peptidylprolyl isomerase [Bacteroidota bacterium]